MEYDTEINFKYDLCGMCLLFWYYHGSPIYFRKFHELIQEYEKIIEDLTNEVDYYKVCMLLTISRFNARVDSNFSLNISYTKTKSMP